MADYRESTIGVSSKVDYFKLPPLQEGFLKAHMVEHRPTNQISDEGPYDILIPGSSEFIDLANTNLYVKIKMVNASTGADFADTILIGCINNMMNSLFSQIDVELNGVVVSSNTQNHAYRSYLRTLLENGADVKNTRLQSSGWYKDTALSFHDPKPTTGDNYGLYERFEIIKGSRPAALYGKMNTDMSTGIRYIPPGVDILFRLWRTKDIFFFMKDVLVLEIPKVKILDIYLDVKKANPSSDYVLGFEHGISTKPALMPYQRSRIQTYNVAASSTFISEDLVFQNEIPDVFVCGIVYTTGFTGTFNKNPYNFSAGYGLTQITYFVDDVAVPAKHYKTETDGTYLGISKAAYDNLFTSFGQHDSSQFDNDITVIDFKGGNNLYVINVRAAIESEMLQVKKKGNFKIELEFAANGEARTLICMGLFEDVFAIDGSRNIVKRLPPIE